MTLNTDELTKLLAGIVGPEHVFTSADTIEPELQNSLAARREALGVVFPGSSDEIRRLVAAAAEHGIPLYPVSRGLNCGYGNTLPVRDGQLIINLRRMNRIRSFDAQRGLIEVEPGVTQGDVQRFLERQGGEYLFDATSASSAASVIGNVLEGGFGFTPLGNRRDSIVDLEVVLGNGELLNTGKFPGIGPNLAGLFVQSNFGVITAVTCRVMLRPPRIIGLAVKLADERKLGKLIETLAALRQRGIIETVPHIANAVRSVMLSQPFNEVWNRPQRLGLAQARQIMSWGPFRAGAWNGFVALYGSSREVAYRRRIIGAALSGIASIYTVDDRRLAPCKSVLALEPLARLAPLRRIRHILRVLEYSYGLAKGVPGELAWEACGWRAAQDDEIGLMLHAPVLDPTQHDIAELLNLTEDVFRKFDFDMPVTMSVVDAANVVCVFSISFNKADKTERERAYAAYSYLVMRCRQSDFAPSRLSILAMPQAHHPPARAAVLQTLKRGLDPQNIIAPGRYGLG